MLEGGGYSNPQGLDQLSILDAATPFSADAIVEGYQNQYVHRTLKGLETTSCY